MSEPVYEPPTPPQTRRLGSPYALLLALLACLALGLWAATQYVAWGFGFHSNLGPAWLFFSPESAVYIQAGAVLAAGFAASLVLFPGVRRFTLPLILLAVLLVGLSQCFALYAPHRFLGWAASHGGLEETSPYARLFQEGLLFGGGTSVLALLSVLALRGGRRALPVTGSHGTAAWGDGEAFTTGTGLLLGRKRTSRGVPKLLRYGGEGHLLTAAPTRSGKGTGSVIPNLLTYSGSVVVTDPKGENYAVTARCRRERLAHRTVALDPFDLLSAFGLPPSEAAFNPMDLISTEGTDFLEGASLLADMLVVPQGGRGGGENAFWAEEAKALLSGLILYVAAKETDGFGRPTERRSLLRVRELLTLPREEFRELMEAMQRSTLAGGLVARAAARLLQKEDKERSGVVSTAQSHTHFLDSSRMARVMGRSTFEMSTLKRERLSLYLILPAHHLDTYSRWLRLTIACALNEMVSVPNQYAGGPGNRVLFLLDEFAQLGRMDPVLRAVSLLAGYGAQLWFFLQDLSQLKGTYPDRWQTFLANTDVLQAFGTNDHETARLLSELTGEATIYVETGSESLSRSRGRHASRSEGRSQSYAERPRKLLLPDEVRRLPREAQLLFLGRQRPVLAQKLDYLRDGVFVVDGEPVFDPNPMHLSESAQQGLP